VSSTFKPNDKLLFIGDSITDAGRTNDHPPYGRGYMYVFKNMFTTINPELKLNFINKGICGNTLKGLELRWEKDVLNESPDHIFILIGINDAAVQLDKKQNLDMILNDFEKTYSHLLRLCIENKISSITCMTPFYINNDSTSPLSKLTLQYIEIIENICYKLSIPLINIQKVFQDLLKTSSADLWSRDGIHPSKAGHIMIAEALYNSLDIENNKIL